MSHRYKFYRIIVIAKGLRQTNRFYISHQQRETNQLHFQLLLWLQGSHFASCDKWRYYLKKKKSQDRCKQWFLSFFISKILFCIWQFSFSPFFFCVDIARLLRFLFFYEISHHFWRASDWSYLFKLNWPHIFSILWRGWHQSTIVPKIKK